MSIPDFQSMMLPLLKMAGDQQEHASRDAVEHIARIFQVTDEERAVRLPSGQGNLFGNRVHWALTHLRHAGLLISTRRGFFKISERGIQVLQQNPSHIDDRFLSQFPEFIQFIRPSREEKVRNGNVETAKINLTDLESSKTPRELLEEGYQSIRQDLAEELLSRVKTCSPGFFERLVVELLVRMGYGGSIQDAGEVVGKSGDEGIDGVIKEDRLGLDTIYIQAKKWEGSIGRPEIQKFVGALHGQRARKGVFITTSDFSSGAREYAANIDSKVVLIDGKQLAQLMIDYDVGVASESTYEIKKVDSDYFTEL